MKILFVDATCPKPYDNNTLVGEPLGGTEATVIRVANALYSRGHEVEVTQHNRSDVASQGVCFTPFGFARKQSPTHVIVLRAPLALPQARKQFPSAKLFVWFHDLFGGNDWDKGFQAIVDTNTVPVCVSNFHQQQMYDHMKAIAFRGAIPSRKIYNPIDNDLNPDTTPVDVNKLVFFSSPHKGLEHTLKIFSRFQDFPELKEMQLYVANPGYFPNHETNLKNVVNLGALSHPDVIHHVRSALCVFHLNAVFPETFGLVHAEANAVATPFINHRMGAVPETADHPAELIDVNDAKAVIERMISWRKLGRPKVRACPTFRMSRIVREWEELFAL